MHWKVWKYYPLKKLFPILQFNSEENKILLNPLLIGYDEICVSPKGTNSCSFLRGERYRIQDSRYDFGMGEIHWKVWKYYPLKNYSQCLF
jgi:hypothetical protein